ncbi:helix-turn-helix transcriptional regulator [Flavihumibacter rivuli]|uniref:AraC family transcriptional regulator n=1 Tax=Flavihumibacter rivuli TaxID=2838156 RepID=UPI001BDE3FAA|nr:AraC family transcriptional regulator [Flavihumibacter rivuli]ULQ56738.1 helix-turn-helix transcriptional regulator [Flavihumibacter rivuli]
MFNFEYQSYNYNEIAKELARALHVKLENNRVNFPEDTASGYMQFIDLPNNLQASISNYTINDNFYYKRKRIPEEYYVLRYEDIKITDELTLKIDGEELKTRNEYHAGVYLTTTLFDVSYLAKKGSSFKGINIIFNKEWMANHLGIADPEEVLSTYLSLRTGSYTIEPIDNEYRRYFNDILHSDNQGPLWIATVQNRIMLLIERFFSRLYEKSKTLMAGPKISKHDVHQLMHVESLLTRDIHSRPPTIDQLAQEAAMSSAKLKKLFKEVYGTSIYAYYQRQRMSVAREMLLSGEFTVKEVGLQLGYSNLSNFAAAFKKEFNILPSEIRA